jgi:8-oxo-dGTP pyrophosphatase MutT (NUDIX family)
LKERYKIPSAVFLILDRIKNGKHEFLLQLRQNTGYSDGLWDLAVGGHLEKGETLKTCLVREAKEEININIEESDLKFLLLSHDRFPHTDYINVYFKASKYTGKMKINEEEKIKELKFFDFNGLPDEMIPNRRKAIENYVKKIYYDELAW